MFVATLVALGCGGPADSGSRETGAAGEAAEVAAVVYSDTLRTVLDRLATMFAPVETWRERALAELRADSGTARADTLFLRLRLEGKAAVRQSAQAFSDHALQAVMYPDGGWASAQRRETFGRSDELDSLALARADTIVDWLRARWLWAFRAEGDAYVELDEQQLLESLGPFVSAEIRGFLRMWARDQRDPVAGDAVVRVAPDELARRITDIELFSDAHPASPVAEPVATRYNWYLWIYLNGLPNTPAVNRDTRMLRDEWHRSYEQYVADRPSSRTAAVVSEYLAILDRSKFTRSAEVGRFLAARREAFDSRLLRY